MPIKFNKKNLVYILLIANLEKGNGRFVSDIIKHSSDKIRAQNAKSKEQKNTISRSTLYSYFDDLNFKIDSYYTHEMANDLATKFVNGSPRKADKFYKHFNIVLFDAFYEFLLKNNYLNKNIVLDATSEIDNSLYFSMATFLSVDERQIKLDCKILCGHFRVYRPSLSSKGKIIASCACISKSDNGAIRYDEIMHYKYRNKWRRQLLNGYIIGKMNKYILVTTDTNTHLMQLAILKSKYVDKNKAETLFGSYNGFSNNVKTGHVMTSIYLARDDFREWEQGSFENWDIRSIPHMGLINPDEIEHEILDDLFAYPQEIIG